MGFILSGLVAGERTGGAVPFGEFAERSIFALEGPSDECFVAPAAVPCEVVN